MTIEEARANWTEVCEIALDLVIEGREKSMKDAMEIAIMGVNMSRSVSQFLERKRRRKLVEQSYISSEL